jgi:antitoxin HicB
MFQVLGEWVFAKFVAGEESVGTMRDMVARDYKVFLEPDIEYGGYVVVCPSLPGTYSQGKTVSQALANIREAIESTLEDMESRGEVIADPAEVLVGSVVITR